MRLMRALDVMGIIIVMGNTDTKILNTSIPQPKILGIDSKFGIDKKRYK